MKNYLVIIASAASLIFSCKEGRSTAFQETNAGTERERDSLAITNTIHDFYKWYEVFSLDTNTQINFVVDKDEHLALDESRMKEYYVHFMNTGLVDTSLVIAEYAFYRDCEKIWKTQPLDEVPYGLDGDKFFCAQDWEVSFWTSAPIKIMELNKHHARVALFGIVFKQPLEREFELKKVGGKWLLSNVKCYE